MQNEISIPTFRESFNDIILCLFSANMAYNSIAFMLYLFLFFCVYAFLKKNAARKIWIFTASVVFYAWQGWQALFIVAFTALVVYLTTRKISGIYEGFEQEKETLEPKEQTAALAKYKTRARWRLLLGMFLIGGLWIFVKICKFVKIPAVKTLPEILTGGGMSGIIVPLGISYYTLSSVGFMLDVFWRKAKFHRNFFDLFNAMIYFPHIVQGPISRYEKLMRQFNEIPEFSYARLCSGLQLMLWGLIKKMIVADRLALYARTIFGAPEKFAGVEILVAVVLAVVQLYADFSGCMDIVRGISEAIGIELDRNFNQPFFSRSAAEFWRRWHITLGAWWKDYIYLPIAMNSKFIKKKIALKKEKGEFTSNLFGTVIPLLAVWTFTGLWHGTGLDYLCWGYYWGAIMALSQLTTESRKRTIAKCGIEADRAWFKGFQIVRTCIIHAVGRMFTVAGSLAGFGVLWRRLFAEHRLWTLFDGSLYRYGLDRKDFYVALLGMVIMLIVDIVHEKGILIRRQIDAQPLPLRWIVYYAAILAVAILGMYGPDFSSISFAYGAF